MFEKVAQNAEADIVIVGHTHVPTHVQIDGVHILNPGSVYDHGSHTCAILTLPNFSFEVFDICTRHSVQPYPLGKK